MEPGVNRVPSLPSRLLIHPFAEEMRLERSARPLRSPHTAPDRKPCQPPVATLILLAFNALVVVIL